MIATVRRPALEVAGRADSPKPSHEMVSNVYELLVAVIQQ